MKRVPAVRIAPKFLPGRHCRLKFNSSPDLSVNYAARSLLVLVLFAPAAWSSGWGAVLNDKAITDFNDDDIREYLDTVYALLDAPLPAAPVQWSNPRTGAGAGLEVIGQPQIEGFAECRRVRTNVYSRKHKAEPRTWTACRDADGGWRLVKGT